MNASLPEKRCQRKDHRVVLCATDYLMIFFTTRNCRNFQNKIKACPKERKRIEKKLSLIPTSVCRVMAWAISPAPRLPSITCSMSHLEPSSSQPSQERTDENNSLTTHQNHYVVHKAGDSTRVTADIRRLY